jgi:hypothetical protein
LSGGSGKEVPEFLKDLTFVPNEGHTSVFQEVVDEGDKVELVGEGLNSEQTTHVRVH